MLHNSLIEQKEDTGNRQLNRFDTLDNELIVYMMDFLFGEETVALSLANRSMYATVVYKYTCNDIFGVTDESKPSYPQQIFQYPQSLFAIELGKYFYPKEHPLKIVNELTALKDKRDESKANALITLCKEGYSKVVPEPEERINWPLSINFKMLTLLFSIGYNANYTDASGTTGLGWLLRKYDLTDNDFLMVDYYLVQPNLRQVSVTSAFDVAGNKIRIKLKQAADTYNITDILMCHCYLQKLAADAKEQKQDTSRDADAINALLDETKSATLRKNKKVNFEELENSHPLLLKSKRIAGFYQNFKKIKLIKKKLGIYEDVRLMILEELQNYKECWFKSKDRCTQLDQLINDIQKLNGNSVKEMQDLITNAKAQAKRSDLEANAHCCFFKRNTFTGGRFDATLQKIEGQLNRWIMNNNQRYL